MNNRSMLAASLLLIGGLSSAVFAQPSPNHTFSDWLQDAVSAASEGCTEIYRSHDWTYEHLLQHTLMPQPNGSFISRLDKYERSISGENKAWWSSTVFSADILSADGISLTPAKNRPPVTTNENSAETYAWTCHELTIALARPAPYSSADGEPDEISTLSFEVNGWALGKELSIAFKRLADGNASSGASAEPK